MLHGVVQSVSLGGHSSPRGSLPAVTSCDSICVSTPCSSASCTVSWDQVRARHEPDHAEPKWGFSPGPANFLLPLLVRPALLSLWFFDAVIGGGAS